MKIKIFLSHDLNLRLSRQIPQNLLKELLSLLNYQIESFQSKAIDL